MGSLSEARDRIASLQLTARARSYNHLLRDSQINIAL